MNCCSLDDIRVDVPDRISAYQRGLHLDLPLRRPGVPPDRSELLRPGRWSPLGGNWAEESRRRVLLPGRSCRMVCFPSLSLPFPALFAPSLIGIGLLTNALGRYLTLHLLIKDSIVELPLGDTSKYFRKSREAKR